MGQVKSCTRKPNQSIRALSKSLNDISDDFCDETIPSSPSIISLNSNGLSDDGKNLEQAMDRIYQKLESTLNEFNDDDSLVSRLGEFIERQKLYQELVNLNFNMFREIAKILEANANKRLERIRHNKSSLARRRELKYQKQSKLNNGEFNKDTTNNNSTNMNDKKTLVHGYDGGSARRISTIINRQIEQLENSSPNLLLNFKDNLNLILLELVDAADCYAKSGCFKRSDNCEKKAKLIALQLAFAPHDIDIIDNKLTKSTNYLHNLIVSFDIFHCAKIVADAYDYQVGWRQAIFNHVLLDNNLKYLDDYCDNCEFSTILVEELILLYKQYISTQRFHLTPERAHAMSKSLKYVINKLPDVEMKCKFYNQLEFSDANDQLLKSDASIEAHLRDLKLV